MHCKNQCYQGRIPCVSPWECELHTEQGGATIDQGAPDLPIHYAGDEPEPDLLWLGLAVIFGALLLIPVVLALNID